MKLFSGWKKKKEFARAATCLADHFPRNTKILPTLGQLFCVPQLAQLSPFSLLRVLGRSSRLTNWPFFSSPQFDNAQVELRRWPKLSLASAD